MADDKTKDEKQEETPQEKAEDTKADENTQEEVKEEESKEKDSKEEKAEEKEAADKSEEAEAETDSDSDADDSVEVPEKFQGLVEQIEQMPVLELNELVKVLEKRFGVSAVAAAAPAAATGGGAEEEEKSTATVSLTSAGSQKIGVIKVVKNILGLGLKEAKDLVDSAPVDLKEEMPKAEAEDLKSQIEEAGGSVELK